MKTILKQTPYYTAAKPIAGDQVKINRTVSR